MKHFFLSLILSSTSLLAFSHADKAHVDVADAWIRPTVDGQMGTGGFMTLKAREGSLRLVAVRTSVAGLAEIHEMRMGKDNVMQMRPITELDLPEGKTVELKPGGHHLMLMNLKQTLVKDTRVAITLVFKDAKNRESRLLVQVPVTISPAARVGQVEYKH